MAQIAKKVCVLQCMYHHPAQKTYGNTSNVRSSYSWLSTAAIHAAALTVASGIRMRGPAIHSLYYQTYREGPSLLSADSDEEPSSEEASDIEDNRPSLLPLDVNYCLHA